MLVPQDNTQNSVSVNTSDPGAYFTMRYSPSDQVVTIQTMTGTLGQ